MGENRMRKKINYLFLTFDETLRSLHKKTKQYAPVVSESGEAAGFSCSISASDDFDTGSNHWKVNRTERYEKERCQYVHTVV